jgi:Zn-dependent protease
VPSITGQVAGAWGVVGSVLFIAFMLNSVLMFYNLLPLPPLDGSAIPLFFLKPNKAEEYQHFIWQPQVSMVGMLVAFYFGGGVVWPLFFKLYGFLIHVIMS